MKVIIETLDGLSVILDEEPEKPGRNFHRGETFVRRPTRLVINPKSIDLDTRFLYRLYRLTQEHKDFLVYREIIHSQEQIT